MGLPGATIGCILLLTLTQPSASFSPAPTLPLAAGVRCHAGPLRGAAAALRGARRGGLTTLRQSSSPSPPSSPPPGRGGSASKAEQADLNFALWDAAKNGETAKVERLAKEGANVNYYDPEMLQATAVQWAANNGHADTLKKLVELGASVHPTNQFGWTAMHHAANWGYVDCVDALIKAGADPMALSESGKTPAQAASFKGFEPVVELIRSVAGDLDGLMEQEDGEIVGYA
eukprot:CAMPEP_0206248794 /NCGR_PEP_ID=MMETSP0047_2-20121206/20563_1 /ASSEMBLY_ACC=CAM_ASM_000192 /TAXON_ID=195065 /ORGANISM="Chroomonas mesostigmatica_cf, Strain CCMP1168" /LENGTH=230 /DNA_ID=CAMNT_0053674469 /DNA_START=150 /DNA_END=838 /DNA_ORIENTATION=-